MPEIYLPKEGYLAVVRFLDGGQLVFHPKTVRAAMVVVDHFGCLHMDGQPMHCLAGLEVYGAIDPLPLLSLEGEAVHDYLVRSYGE